MHTSGLSIQLAISIVLKYGNMVKLLWVRLVQILNKNNNNSQYLKPIGPHNSVKGVAHNEPTENYNHDSAVPSALQ